MPDLKVGPTYECCGPPTYDNAKTRSVVDTGSILRQIDGVPQLQSKSEAVCPHSRLTLNTIGH